MAEEKFRLIFETQGLDEIEKQIEESVIAVEKLKERKKELRKELKEGKISTEQYATSIFEVNNQIKDYQNKIKSLTTTQAALNVANKEGALSYNDLTKLYREAEKELRRLEGTLKVNEDGTIELNEAYQEQLEKVRRLREAIIEFDQSIKDGRTNVGNYKDAVEELEEKLDEIDSEIKGASAAINGLKDSFEASGEIIDKVNGLATILSKQGLQTLVRTLGALAKALLTNPIFLIAAVLIGIYHALKNTSKGFEALSKVTQGFGKIASAVFKVIQPLIDGIAEALLVVADLLVDVADTINKALGNEAVSTLSELQSSLEKVERQAEALSNSFDRMASSIDAAFELINKRVAGQVKSIRELIDDTQKLSDNLIKESEKTVVELTKARVKLLNDLQSTSGKRFTEFEAALKAGAVVSEQELSTYQKILELDSQIKQIDLDKYRLAEERLNLEAESFGLQAEALDLLIQIKQTAGEINLEEGKGLDVYKQLREQQIQLVFLQEERAARTTEEVENARLRLRLAQEQLNAELAQAKAAAEERKAEQARIQKETEANNEILSARLKIAESKSKEFFYTLQIEKTEKSNRQQALEYLKIVREEKEKQLLLEYQIALIQAEQIENEDERALAIKEANRALFEAQEALKKELSDRALSIAVDFDIKQNQFDVSSVQGNLFRGLQDFYKAEQERLDAFKEQQKQQLQELLDNGLISYQQFTESLQSIEETYFERSQALQDEFKNNFTFWQQELVNIGQNTVGLLGEFGANAFELVKAANEDLINQYIQTGKQLPAATKSTLKTFFAIQKAAAIANIVISQSQALANELKNASTLPPPANVAYYAAAAARVVATMTSLLSTIKGTTFENALGAAGGGGVGSVAVVSPKTVLGRQIIETSGSATAQNEANVAKNPDQLRTQQNFVVDVKDIRQGVKQKGNIEDNRQL
jgi:uncharacterized membrane protein required for colicin V production